MGSSAQIPAASPVIFAATVKLPEFWQHDPDPWFQHTDAQFHLRGITADETRYFHVVSALDSSNTRRIMGLLKDLPLTGKYGALKAMLLQVFQLSDAERAARLLSLNGLEDAKPTARVRVENMLVLMRSGDTSFLFIQLFLRQLPPPVHTVLDTSPLTRSKDYRGLVEEADRILLASRCSHVHAALQGQLQPPLEDGAGPALAAVCQTDNRELCFYHRRLGAKARRCILPCPSATREMPGLVLSSSWGTGAAGRLLFVEDEFSRRRLLADTGTQLRVMPASAVDALAGGGGPPLDAANGMPIRTFC
ncbi:uncharacterized protein [Antennarius striatus]|uniref:uncharacterized protein isoform X2 n=1 Tax=Antennarius striatus TaxID=241820 RepID=UPI0035ADBA12